MNQTNQLIKTISQTNESINQTNWIILESDDFKVYWIYSWIIGYGLNLNLFMNQNNNEPYKIILNFTYQDSQWPCSELFKPWKLSILQCFSSQSDFSYVTLPTSLSSCSFSIPHGKSIQYQFRHFCLFCCIGLLPKCISQNLETYLSFMHLMKDLIIEQINVSTVWYVTILSQNEPITVLNVENAFLTWITIVHGLITV